MKKIYTYIGCAVIVISTTCMENHITIDIPCTLPLMQALYNETYSFLKDEKYDRYLNAPMQYNNKQVIKKNSELVNLITTINSAKKSNITEDELGRFAYDLLEGMDGYNNQLCIPLFFSCLKRYNLTAKESNECLPDILELQNNFFHQELSQTFYASRSICIQSKRSIENRFSMKSLLQRYPAYRTFLNTIIKLIHEQWRFGVDIHKDFIACIYTNKEILFKDYYMDDYNHIVRDFYTQTYDLFHDKKIDATNPRTFLWIILDILRSIGDAKALQDITDEQNLGQDILNFEVPQLTLTSIFGYFRPKNDIQKFDIITTKNRISLFCLMLKKYNDLRKNKQTPHLLQHFYYQVKNDLQLALPDNYANCVFDESKYAFTELDQLINDFQALVYADNETIQQWVTQLYYSRK